MFPPNHAKVMSEVSALARAAIISAGMDSPIADLLPVVIACLESHQSELWNMADVEVTKRGTPTISRCIAVKTPDGPWPIKTPRALTVEIRKGLRDKRDLELPQDDPETPRGPTVGGKGRIIHKGEFPGQHT